MCKKIINLYGQILSTFDNSPNEIRIMPSFDVLCIGAVYIDSVWCLCNDLSVYEANSNGDIKLYKKNCINIIQNILPIDL